MHLTWCMVAKNKSGYVFYTYVLLMANRQLYAGFTADLKRRLSEHQRGQNNTTSRFLPVKLIFYEAFLSETDARRRENYFKTSKGKSTIQLMIRESLGH